MEDLTPRSRPGWFNNARLHQSRGDTPPAKYEALDAPQTETTITL